MADGTRLILLVEDDPDHELLTIRALKKSNVANDVRVARDGEEALALLFGEDAIKPQVILLDLKLPKVDGLEVLRRIRESNTTVNFTDFAEATRQLGMYWLVLNECPPQS